MGHFLDWFNHNNTLFIQILFGVVGLLLCFLIYKLFFGTQTVEADGAPSMKVIEEKLTQMLEVQKQKISGAVTADSNEEVEKLRTEIYSLRQSLKEKEAQVEQSAQNATSGSAESAAATAAVDEAAIAEYKKKIEELETRLSDYEVIAEDIADLHRLREENDKLKAQVSGGLSTAAETVSGAPTETETSVVEPVAEIEPEPAPVDEPTAVVAESEAPVEAAPTEENKAPTEQELAISELEKQLISDFEKAKG